MDLDFLLHLPLTPRICVGRGGKRHPRICVGTGINLADLTVLTSSVAVVYLPAHHGGIHICLPSTKVQGPPSLSFPDPVSFNKVQTSSLPHLISSHFFYGSIHAGELLSMWNRGQTTPAQHKVKSKMPNLQKMKITMLFYQTRHITLLPSSVF